MNVGFIVAIDGPAGSGKGTVTKIISEKENLISIDTGAMYRCVALDCIKNGIDYENLQGIEERLKDIDIELKNSDGQKFILLNGKDVTKEIRTPEVDAVVAKFAQIKIIRDKMTPLQRKMGTNQDIIMEGRDIGTVVFPNADVKIYLECSVEERARRRYKQNQAKNIECTYEEVLESIKERNKLETEREIAPLIKADDAVLVDSTNLTIDEVVNKISEIINQKRNNKIGKEIQMTKDESNIIEKSLEKKTTSKAKMSKVQDEKREIVPKYQKPKILKRIARVIVKSAIFAYCKIVYRMKIIGTENIPKEGAVIFCGNHRSYLDPPLIEVTCKRSETRFIAKQELTKNKFLALLGYIFDAILVNRDSKDIGAIKESLKTLKQGECIALFPEGTRNGLAKGEKAKDGVAFFALNSDATVIPVGIKGGLKAFQKVTITYGKPLDFSKDKANKKDKNTMDKVTSEIMEEIIRLAEK